MRFISSACFFHHFEVLVDSFSPLFTAVTQIVIEFIEIAEKKINLHAQYCTKLYAQHNAKFS